jgi:hypothetical protein
MQILCSKGAQQENERSAENIGINENFDLICPRWIQLGIPAGINKETVSG